MILADFIKFTPGTLLKIFFIFFLIKFPGDLLAQPFIADSLPAHYNIDSLKKIYGIKKKLLHEYELQTLIALSYYPELRNEHITFKYAPINGTAQTTVTFASIFRYLNKRYIILINDDVHETGLLLSDAPFDAQVAVLGHEFAHVADFKTRSFFDMVWWGLGYLVGKKRTRIENRTDKSTILHGLGWPLYHWSDFALNYSKATDHYKRVRAAKYMHPGEILEYMKKHHLD